MVYSEVCASLLYPRCFNPGYHCVVLSFVVVMGHCEKNDRALIKAYGATKEGKEDAIQRSTVLVDKQGKVAAVWNPVSLLAQYLVTQQH